MKSFRKLYFSSLLILSATLCLLMLPTGCKSHKSAVGSTSSVSRNFEGIVERNPSWEALQLPFTLRLSGAQNISVGGVATFQRDRSVNLSMRFMGLEVAVADISDTAIVVCDKYNKRYLDVDIASLIGQLPLNISNLEDLLLGRVFLPGANSLSVTDSRNFQISKGNPITLKPKADLNYGECVFNIAPETMTVSSLDITPHGRDVVRITCSDFTEAPVGSKGMMASLVAVPLMLKDRPLNVSLEWNFAKAKWNDEVRPKPFSIPANYTKMDFQSLLKAVEALR